MAPSRIQPPVASEPHFSSLNHIRLGYSNQELHSHMHFMRYPALAYKQFQYSLKDASFVCKLNWFIDDVLKARMAFWAGASDVATRYEHQRSAFGELTSRQELSLQSSVAEELLKVANRFIVDACTAMQMRKDTIQEIRDKELQKIFHRDPVTGAITINPGLPFPNISNMNPPSALEDVELSNAQGAGFARKPMVPDGCACCQRLVIHLSYKAGEESPPSSDDEGGATRHEATRHEGPANDSLSILTPSASPELEEGNGMEH